MLLPPQGDGPDARGRQGPPAPLRVAGVVALAAPGSCTFCRIARGELEAVVVAETEHAVSFLDHRPIFPGHTLVIPREHLATLRDLPDSLLGPFFAEVRRLAAAVQDGMGATGTFVAENNVVSQSVPHLHVHVVPRRPKDGLRGFFWPRTKYGSTAEMEAAAEAIRQALPPGSPNWFLAR